MLTEVMAIIDGREEVGWIPGPVWKVYGEIPVNARTSIAVA